MDTDNGAKTRKGRSAFFDRDVVLLVLAIKALLFVFAFHSYQVISDQRVGGFMEFLGLLSRWDSESYLYIAENGYTAFGEKRFLLVFFPLYPMFVAGAAVIFRNYVVSAFVVSGLATIALGLVFKALVRLDYGERTSRLAVLFLFIFPTSYFLHIPYTESLFLALVVACFLAARADRWLVAGILGFLACETRVNGMILFPALFFDIWGRYRETRKIEFRWLWTLLIPAGFGTYLLLNWWVTGNAFKFQQFQRENWQKHFALPFDGIWGKFKGIFELSPSNSNMIAYQELFFILLGFVAIIAGWKYLRGSYRVWMILNWLLFISTSFILSVPRYTLTLFPVFIIMAVAAGRDWRINSVFTVWSVLYLGLFVSLFVTGRWAF